MLGSFIVSFFGPFGANGSMVEVLAFGLVEPEDCGFEPHTYGIRHCTAPNSGHPMGQPSILKTIQLHIGLFYI